MLGRWLDLDPSRHCCCTPAGKARWARGKAELLEEINIGEAHVRGLGVPPGEPLEVLINSARERAGFRCSPPAGPRERAVPTFATAEVEEFQGEPIYAGSILQLTLGESIHEMNLALYANGFSLVPCGADSPGSLRPVSRAWSPFSLVEKCQVKTMQHSAYWAVFKLTVFRKEGQDRCYYFATTGNDAYKERDRWVTEMVGAVGGATASLFPRRSITVQPLPGVAATSSRIMAGYLLQNGASDNVSLFYCELQAYSHGKARLAIYQNEWCEQEVGSVLLADSSTVSTRRGDYCTVFGVDSRRFCARTCEEKELWVRAISNVKVKLMFDAPDPTDEELGVFRDAVRERLGELGTAEVAEGAAGAALATPLLSRVPRLPPLSPRGDAWDPEPMEEASCAPSSRGNGSSSMEDGDDCDDAEVAPPGGAPAYCALPQAVGHFKHFESEAGRLQHHAEAEAADGLFGPPPSPTQSSLGPDDEPAFREAEFRPLASDAEFADGFQSPLSREMPKVPAVLLAGGGGAGEICVGTPCYAGCLPGADAPPELPPPGEPMGEPMPHSARRGAERPHARFL